jgi:hypothetical protein
MTDATIALAGMAELADTGPGVDMLRQMVQCMAQRPMDMDVESLCGAACDEKSAERLNSRNGFRDRSWETRTGTGALKIPKLRQGSDFPGLLAPHRRAGHGRAHPGARRARCVHALRGRSGQGPGHDRHLREPGQPAVRCARRAAACADDVHGGVGLLCLSEPARPLHGIQDAQESRPLAGEAVLA